jgi:2-iminoacetate synthase
MFSIEYKYACERVSDLSRTPTRPLDLLQSGVALDFAPILWASEFGQGGDLDRDILARSARLKSAFYERRLFVIVPIYVTSVCQEQCVYCNFRAGNKGISVERKRLTIEELEREALFLIHEKNMRVLELVYSADPQIRVDSMCRHVELLRRLLDQHGGGLVGLSAEAFDEPEYRRLVNAGLCWSVVWQETYDKARYASLHPGKTKKTHFEYRLDCYERMLAAGVPHVGVGVLSGLSDWRRDWAMLMVHEEYLRKRYGNGATILGTPRLKLAPGAIFQESPCTPTRQEFLATIALHNIYSPTTVPFVSTREDWDVCVELAKGGGCLFTLNCSTTPGGYSQEHHSCQFTSGNYDAPVFSEKLRGLGFHPVFDWKSNDLSREYQPIAVAGGGI